REIAAGAWRCLWIACTPINKVRIDSLHHPADDHSWSWRWLHVRSGLPRLIVIVVVIRLRGALIPTLHRTTYRGSASQYNSRHHTECEGLRVSIGIAEWIVVIVVR